MKKALCLMLTLVLVVCALTGCSNEAGKLVGTWEGQINMTDLLMDALGAEFGELITLGDVIFTMSITFNKDGTYKAELDRDSVETAFDGIWSDLEDSLIDMLEQEIAAMGLDISVEEMLEASGMDLDTLMEETLAEIDADSLIDDIVDEASFEGNFKAKGGKLFLSDGYEYQPDPAIYEVYTVSGNTLTFSDPGLEDSAFVGLYPITFTKVA